MPKGGNGGGGGGKPGGGGGGGGVNQINGHDKKDDTLIGTDGKDAILGKGGDDTLTGLAGDDFLSGGDGDDHLDGGADNDRLFGSQGNDTLVGGSGDDELQGGAGFDLIDGGSGWDVAYYMETPDNGIRVNAYVDDDLTDDRGYDITFLDGVTASEDAQNVEGIAATNYADEMNGGEYDDWFDGVGGNDTILGNGGDDAINGGAGNDDIDGGDDNDMLYGGSGDDTIDGGAGNDVIDGGSNAWWEQPDQDMIDGGAGNDTISGGGGDDFLTGGADADTFVYYSASEGGNSITDFSGDSGQGDTIDLSALNPDGFTLTELIDSDSIFVVGGDKLFVDLDGGGPGEMVDGEPLNDDILIATFTDGGGGFVLADDVLV